jgi:transposase InsO family protein
MGYDNGSEFKRYFKEMIDNYGIKSKTSTEYNSQSNGIIESTPSTHKFPAHVRPHQTTSGEEGPMGTVPISHRVCNM